MIEYILHNEVSARHYSALLPMNVAGKRTCPLDQACTGDDVELLYLTPDNHCSQADRSDYLKTPSSVAPIVEEYKFYFPNLFVSSWGTSLSFRY